jgi:putative endopeptidase
MKVIYFSFFTASLFLFSCKNENNNNSNAALADILHAHIDTTIQAGDDFFEYTNGGWLKANPIPASESGWGIFNLVEDENQTRIKTISEEATSAHAAKGTPTQQIGDFFSSGMDSMAVEKNDIAPLKDIFSQINNCKTTADIVHTITSLQQIGVSPLFSLGVGQDMKISDKNRVYLGQGGLGLPDRDYYFNTDAQTTKIRKEYPMHIQRMLTMLYQDSVKAKMQSEAIVKLETSIAAAHKKLEELRDPYANYNKMSMAQVNALGSNFAFENQLKTLNLMSDSIIVGQPVFFQKIQVDQQ